jgi:uncharacterized NAD(P)/FAD-binding protein YdhS
MTRVHSRGPTVAVIGGGFCGLLTAVHLLSQDRQVTVRLVERTPQFGRGRAFDASDARHLLNVRAANMSAFPDRPAHFMDWLASDGGATDAAGFVSRRQYGEYLQAVLRSVIRGDGVGGRLLLELDECIDLAPVPAGFEVVTALGRSFEANAVVLALGAGPPPLLPGVDPDVVRSPAYFGDPWGAEVLKAPDGPVLLLGSGLTMVDVAMSLERPGRTLTVLSRRGLLPRSHAPTGPSPAPDGSFESPLKALRTLRTHAAAVGWREALDSVRPLTPATWRAWSTDHRRQFLRHALPWWDAYRHRTAPSVAAWLEQAVNQGRLQVVAGRLETLTAAEGGLSALYRLRGRRTHVRQMFAAVVNCTGQSARLDNGGTLLRRLLLRGLIRPDALELGLDVDDQFGVLARSGHRSPGLWAVGPLARAARWETVAVPDLRHQTAETARTVLAALQSPVAAAPRL